MGDNDSDFQQRRSKRRKIKPNDTVPNAADTEASDPVDDLTARMPSGTQCSTITYHSRQCKLAAAAKTHSHSCSDDSYEQTCYDSDMESDDFRDDASTRGSKRGRKHSAVARSLLTPPTWCPVPSPQRSTQTQRVDFA